MANHASARKRIRQTATRTERNKHVRTTMRTLVKRVRVAITEEDKSTAQTALRAASQYIDKAVAKGLYHRKAGSRYVARLSAQVARLG